ncbi:MAG: YbdD/YjiX family protein [Gemmatimonadaceae bacterium]
MMLTGVIPRVLRTTARVVRAIVGAPDYETYLWHMHSRHPDIQPLSAFDFARERLERRYNSAGSRCC